MKTLTLVIPLILLLVACGGADATPPAGAEQPSNDAEPTTAVAAACSDDDFEVASAFVIDGAIAEFGQVEQVAQSTSRIALSPLVRDMQEVMNDLAAEPWPDCAAIAKSHFHDGMQGTIDLYLAFMDDAGQATMTKHQTTAALAWRAATQRMLDVAPE